VAYFFGPRCRLVNSDVTHQKAQIRK